jgi:fucose 4-O-acetylase-like acetyltransferase
MQIVKERVIWIDYAKAVAIYFVVLLHVGIQNPYRELIDSMVMPVFFFLSGVFFRTEKYSNYSAFFTQRGIKILIPYFFFNIVTYLFWLLIGRHVGMDSGFEINPLEPILGMFYGNYVHLHHYIPLWFLASLFTVESLYFFISKIEKNKILYLTLILCFIGGYINYTFNSKMLPWGIDIALVMIVFFASGNLLKNRFLTLKKNKVAYIIYIVVASIVLFFIFKWNSHPNVFANSYGNYWLFSIGALGGILLFVSFFKLLEIAFKPMRFLLFVGENTLVIYATHLLAISFVKSILIYIFHIDVQMRHGNLVYTLIVGGLTIVTLIPVILLTNRYLPFAVGRGKFYEIFKK